MLVFYAYIIPRSMNSTGCNINSGDIFIVLISNQAASERFSNSKLSHSHTLFMNSI